MYDVPVRYIDRKGFDSADRTARRQAFVNAMMCSRARSRQWPANRVGPEAASPREQ